MTGVEAGGPRRGNKDDTHTHPSQSTAEKVGGSRNLDSHPGLRFSSQACYGKCRIICFQGKCG